MGQGTLRIEVATLRNLLPLWMRSAGFVVDDSMMHESHIMAVDASVPSFGAGEVEGYFSSMLGSLTITDGGMWYRYDDRQKVVFVKIADEKEGEE